MDNIAEPLLRQLVPLAFIGKILEAFIVLNDELLDLLDGQGLILRNRQVFNLVGEQLLLDTGDEVLKKTEGNLE